MAIFTSLAIAAALSIEAGFLTAAAAFVLNAAVGLAASYGLSLAAKALSGNKSAPSAATDNFGVQGALSAGGDVPRSFNLGYSVTAGSLVYANTWGVGGSDGKTPNCFLTQVIALADLPGGSLAELWVNGEKVTVGVTKTDDKGYPIAEYNKDGADFLWINYYDGTQTAADPLCVGNVASIDRPYPSTRVGTGVAYVVVTSLCNDKLFSGFPTFKFAMSGIPLYDPSKDSTNGGSGSHRYSDSTTWGGDGDNLPAVQIYNILRGFYFGGTWLYGLQGMGSARLPGYHWSAQINKCRATITGPDGSEATYRAGGQINVNAQPANAVEAFLTACQGRLSEIGGFYKIHLGAPDSSPAFGMTFTDDDILSSEPQVYRPFFALADSVNGIQGTYPDPAQGWNTATAPAYYRTDLEVKDGNRRLMANPAFDFVPYAGQVQRLQKSAIEEAQRARTHTIVLPPAFWVGEPGDISQWSSDRNGYVDKLFRIDSVIDRANLDVALNITEVDPADYDWNQGADGKPVITGPTIITRPPAQGVLDWFAEAYTLLDTLGQPRRPAIRIAWDGTQPGVDGIQYEVRLTSDNSDVTKGRTDQLAAGALIISQSLIPNTAYQVRGQYLPSWPRDMLWSDWLDVTTPDVSVTLADFDTALQQQITIIQDGLNDKLNFALQQIAALASNDAATNWLDKKQVRSELHAVAGSAAADILALQTVQASDEAAFASYQTTVSASFSSVNASVSTNSAAIATLNGYAAASYAVTLNVNGYATGFSLVNGGAGTSSFVVVADKFQIQLPSYNGNAPQSVFTVGNVAGSPALGISANMFLDGTLNARAVVAGTITGVMIAGTTITGSNIQAGAINTTQLAVGGVDITNLIAGAATAIYTGSYGSHIGSPSVSVTGTIVSGKALIILSDIGGSGSGTTNTYTLNIDGTAQTPAYPVFLAANGNYAQSFQWTISGISNGSHTFTISVSSSGAFTTQGGVLTIIDLRR